MDDLHLCYRYAPTSAATRWGCKLTFATMSALKGLRLNELASELVGTKVSRKVCYDAQFSQSECLQAIALQASCMVNPCLACKMDYYHHRKPAEEATVQFVRRVRSDVRIHRGCVWTWQSLSLRTKHPEKYALRPTHTSSSLDHGKTNLGSVLFVIVVGFRSDKGPIILDIISTMHT